MTREEATKLPALDPVHIYDSARNWIARHSTGELTDDPDGQHDFAYFAIRYLSVPENRADDFSQILSTFERNKGMGIH